MKEMVVEILKRALIPILTRNGEIILPPDDCRLEVAGIYEAALEIEFQLTQGHDGNK